MRAVFVVSLRLVGVALSMLMLGAVPVSAAGPMAIDSAATHTLMGSSAGAIDTYAFTVPLQPVAYPMIVANFTPSGVSDGGQAGFQVYLNGTNIAAGSRGPEPGLIEYTLPQNPSGVVVIQVFNYSSVTVSYSLMVTNVPVNIPNGPARSGSSMDQPMPINGTLNGSLPGSSSGSFAYYSFPSAGANPPTTITLSYAPANSPLDQAVGFNVLDDTGTNIGSAIQPAGQNMPAATIGVQLNVNPGSVLTVQVVNYAQGIPITYRLAVTGIPPSFNVPAAGGTAATTAPSAPGAFQPFWVENFAVTPLWSGTNQHAVSFGNQPQFSSFLVTRPQSGGRLYVLNPRTGNYAYIDAAAVGPSGPPK